MHGKQRSMKLVKLEGCGNSFLIGRAADAVDLPADRKCALARRLCDVNFGIGSDGLILVSDGPEYFELQMFNPDGSLMRMCGNGSRCVCRYLVMEKLLATGQGEAILKIAGRTVTCSLFDDGRLVEVDMGQPDFSPQSIPMQRAEPLISEELALGDGRRFTATVLSIGNPHCVIFFDSLCGIDCAELGPKLCGHELFLDRANIGFARVQGKDSLELKVWERGAGLTMACGSGACAAVVAGIREGRLCHEVDVNVPGGRLKVAWRSKEERVFLSGPAREIARILVSMEDACEEL